MHQIHHARKRVPFHRVVASALLALLLAAPTAFAQDGGASAGTYMLEGGSYTIQLERDGGDLVVVEPNKRSTYASQGNGEYHFYNPNTQTKYGIRVIDARTIEAFKPDFPDNPASRLVLMGGAADAVVESADSGRYEALAEHYTSLLESDPANAQTWVACAGVAMKRSISTVADADAYAGQMAQMLKQLMVDSSRSPCEDVIPASVW